MVVLPGSALALARYEVTVGESQAFASATRGDARGGCTFFGDGDYSWRNPGFPQTARHPVTCMSWNDARAYVSWLSATTGATYRLPTEAEWERAATGSQPGCYLDRQERFGTCPVGAYGANAVGLSDIVGNVWEWMSDCADGDCARGVLRGGSFWGEPEDLRSTLRIPETATTRTVLVGFRVARTLE